MKKKFGSIFLFTLILLVSGSIGMWAEGKNRLADDLPPPKQKVNPAKGTPILKPGPKGPEQIGDLTGDPDKGKLVFVKYCVYCHGKKGLGNGMAAIALKPSPANFILLKTYTKPDQKLFEIITYGIWGSYQLDMPSWGPILSKQDRVDVIFYIKKLTKPE